jgi:hypothetical protein
MSKKRILKQQKRTGGFPWRWMVAGVLLLIVGGIFVWNGVTDRKTIAPQVTGAPHLVVDQTTIDEGDVKLGQTIRSAFRLQNAGDQPLQILGEPQVEVIEGC